MSLALWLGMDVRLDPRRLAGLALGLVFGLVVTTPVGVKAIAALPVISILAPGQNQTVGGNVSFYSVASTSGVVSLQFQVDGHNFGSPITSGACRATWDSTTAGDGLHTIQALALDLFGNTLVSQPVTVMVSNAFVAPPPSPTPTPTPTPTPGGPALTAPASNSTISPNFVAEIQFASGPTTAQFELHTLAGTVVQAWQFTFAAGTTRVERLLTISSPVNGTYDVVGVVNGAFSNLARVTLTGGATAPTPPTTPSPTPGPTPTPPTSPSPTPSPSPAPTLPGTGLPTPSPSPTPTPPPTSPSPTPTPTPPSSQTGGTAVRRTAPAPTADDGSTSIWPRMVRKLGGAEPTDTGTPMTPRASEDTGATTSSAVARTTAASATKSKSAAQSSGSGRTKAAAPTTASPGVVPPVVIGPGPVAGTCTTPDPYKKEGGVGICVAGEWLVLWKPLKGGK